MMDILSTLEIDIILAEKKKPKTRKLDVPMEITLDDDCDNFKNMTMEYERPVPPTLAKKLAPSAETVKQVSPKYRDRKRNFNPSPRSDSVAAKKISLQVEPSGVKKSFNAKENVLKTSERPKHYPDDYPEVLEAQEPSVPSAVEVPPQDLEPLTPGCQSTPKPGQHKRKYLQGRLENFVAVNVKGENLARILPRSDDPIRECEWCKNEYSSDEELQSHVCVENSLDSKDELTLLHQGDDDVSTSSANTSTASSKSLSDIRSEISKKTLGSKLHRTFPSFKTKAINLNSTVSATSGPTPGPSKLVQISTIKADKGPLVMKIPASEIISEMNQNETLNPSAKLQVKTEPGPDKSTDPFKLDCPMCKVSQADPKGLLSHVEQVHFKSRKNSKSEIFWKCFKCTKIVMRKSELLTHAISCRDGLVNKSIKPKPVLKTKPLNQILASACNSCGGRVGNSFYKRKQKCGVCEPCRSPKCGQCKFCQKPSLRKSCSKRICLQMISPRCVCASNSKQN